jgi:hypothetical protein
MEIQINKYSKKFQKFIKKHPEFMTEEWRKKHWWYFPIDDSRNETKVIGDNHNDKGKNI